MDKLAHMVGDKVGVMVEGAVKNALGVGDKKKDKGGLFSFGDDKKKNKGKKDEGKGGFFSHLTDKDDDKDKKGKQTKSGFAGLLSEQEAGAVGENRGETAGGSEGSGGNAGQIVRVNDGDLLDDLIEVAEETSKGK